MEIIRLNQILPSCLIVFKKQGTRQVFLLYSAMVLNLFLGIFISIVNTRFLGPQAYGEFKLINSLFLLLTTLTAFGYYNSAARLVAQRKHERIKRNLFGGSLVASFIIAFINTSALFIFSFYIDDFFQANLSGVVQLCLPLVFVFPLGVCLESIFQGDNRIAQLSIMRVFPRLLYLFFAFIFGFVFELTLISALLLQLILLAIVLVLMVFYLNPAFSDLKNSIKCLNKENKAYGFHVYTGSLASAGLSEVFALTIGYFVDPLSVGFYSLAITVCGPIKMSASVFGTTFFKQFAGSKSISNKVFVSASILSLVVMLIFIIFVKDIIILFYSNKYSSAINLSYILCFGFMLHGFGDIFNRYLGAHGKGKEIRNGATIAGIVSLVAGFILTMIWGVTGTAFATSLSGGLYFIMMLWFYCRRDISIDPIH